MTESVLVVDDDQQMVRTVCDVLRRSGLTAHGAFSGEEAVALSRDQRWSVVLMDIKMGGMSGVDAYRALQTVQPGVPVILMTAYTAPDVVAQATAAGVRRVIAKPFAFPALLAMLGEAVAERRPAPPSSNT